MSPLTISQILARCSLKSTFPSFATRLGLVVTPSIRPSSLASLISSRFAVSIKNFMILAFNYRVSECSDPLDLNLANITGHHLRDSGGRSRRDHVAGKQGHLP